MAFDSASLEAVRVKDKMLLSDLVPSSPALPHLFFFGQPERLLSVLPEPILLLSRVSPNLDDGPPSPAPAPSGRGAPIRAIVT